MKTMSNFSKRTVMATAIAASLGGVAPIQTATAAELAFNWSGVFTMLDSAGSALDNTSLAKGTNRFQTAVTGTLTYDTVLGTGSMTVNSFDFFSGTSPAEATGVTLEAIGDGLGGAGNLVLGNMLFNWNGTNGIPVSIVWDATGLFTAIDGGLSVGDPAVTGTGAVPASDGTYTGATYGYLALGSTPFATTAWNTSFAAGCSLGDCMSVSPSGELPLVVDTVANNNDFVANTGATPGTHDDNVDTFLTYYGVGGNPMADGPFQGFNANFDLTSITLVSDGSVSFTVPTAISVNVPEDPLPPNFDVDLGTPTDVVPGGATVEYCLDTVAACDNGNLWVADNPPNTISVPITQTINTLTVNWRVSDGFGGLAFNTQNVTATVLDTTPPFFTSPPGDVSVSVETTAESVVFAAIGAVTADDLVEPNLTIEWSLDNTTWNAYDPNVATSSSDFGPDANTVYWRVTDVAGNSVTHQQTVTLSLPQGIVGEPCVVDTDLLNSSIGYRQLGGTFIMYDPQGNLVGSVDTAVTGQIDTAVVCADETCTDSGAELASPTPFFSELWTTSAIRLFDQPGTYTFETCLNDGSTQCTAPAPLSMEVGPNQLGAHMLFDWATNKSIDVVLVWNFGCGGAELVTSDPNGDGIPGTRMVDGPFKGFNATFDLKTLAGESPITTGGFATTIPVVKNPVPNTSPIALQPGDIGTVLGGVTITASELFDTYGAAADSGAVESCVGGCFDFTVSGLATGATIQVVLPLSEPIPWYALYRKYDAATDSWRNFTFTDTDNVMTAALDDNDRCPEPGSGDYSTNASGILTNMLRPGDQCVQLTITDGGPNDTDSDDGVIGDPSGVALTSAPPAPEAPTTGSGCTLAADGTTPGQRFDLWLLAGLLGWLGLRRKQAS